MPKRLCNKILSHKFLVTIFTANVFETNHHREYLLIAGGDILAGTTPSYNIALNFILEVLFQVRKETFSKLRY